MTSAVFYNHCCPSAGLIMLAPPVGSYTLALLSMPESVFVLVSPYPTYPSPSHIREHSFSCGDPRVSLYYFNIIGRCNNIIDLRILESLHILKSKPKINAFQTAYPLYIVNQLICVLNALYECFNFCMCNSFFSF